jgi:hypothetical protein
MKIPLHALFEEAFGISEITDEKEYDALIKRLEKEAKIGENVFEAEQEMEAREFEEK